MMGSIVGTREDSGQARIVLDGSAPHCLWAASASRPHSPAQPPGATPAPIWRITDRHSCFPVEPQGKEFTASSVATAHHGEWVKAKSEQTFQTHNPATGELLAECAQVDQVDIDRAVSARGEHSRLGHRSRPRLPPSGGGSSGGSAIW